MVESSSTILKKYRVLRVIAQSSNIVYEGSDATMGRRVAIKELILPEGLNEDQKTDRIQRFYLEARAAGSLGHPNIVTILDMGEENKRQFIVMEFLEGGTVQAALDTYGAFPLKKCIWIAIQMCDALGFAHSKGVVHCDVRPDNVHVLPTGQVKLTDFGTAQFSSQAGSFPGAQLIGTALYMSPEQLSGSAVDLRSDIFSLGILLYEMITGKKPFGGDSVAAVTYSILNNQPPMPAEISPDLQAILRRALAKDPNQRYQNMLQVAGDLRKERLALEALPAGAPDQDQPIQSRPGPTALSGEPTAAPPLPIGAAMGAGFAQPQAMQPYNAPIMAATTVQNPSFPLSSPAPAARPARKATAMGAAVGLVIVSLAAVGGGLFFVHKQPAAPAVRPIPPMASGAVYSDNLLNSWDNYSWTTVNLHSAKPVHSGDSAISVTIAKTYSALFLHNHLFNPTGYKTLSFWINGNAKGCDSLQVQGVVTATTPMPEKYLLPSVPANRWVHEEIPLSTLTMDTTSGCTGFWIQDQTGKTGQSFSVDDIAFEK